MIKVIHIIAAIMLVTTVASATPHGFNEPQHTRMNLIETKATLSGDATVTAAGVLTLSANSVDSAELTAGSVDESHIAVQSSDGKNIVRVVRANLDCTASDCSAGTVSMVQTLPAKALIKKAWYYVEEQFVDGGAGTLAIHCEDAGNILAAADATADLVGASVDGAPDGAGANMVAGIAAECTITATIATAEQTAGILTLYVEYMLID